MLFWSTLMFVIVRVRGKHAAGIFSERYNIQEVDLPVKS
jgi:hypothetical protein